MDQKLIALRGTGFSNGRFTKSGQIELGTIYKTREEAQKHATSNTVVTFKTTEDSRVG